jgi:hypothetical protein
MTVETLVFLVGVSALLMHELDAIQQEEWRFFLGWAKLDDVSAYRIFAAAHFPLFVIILASLADGRFQAGMDVFLILHALAHFLLRNHRYIHFNNGFSRFWIYGGAAAAFTHLLLGTG